MYVDQSNDFPFEKWKEITVVLLYE